MYIDSLLRITQDSSLKKAIISRICKDSDMKSKHIEKFDNIVTGIEAALVSDIIYSDVFEEVDAEGEGEPDNEDIDLDIVETTAFGDLKQYESVDINEDIEDIDEYENTEDFEILSPIQEEDESNKSSEANSLIMAPEEEESESNDSKSSEANSLMMAPEAASESNDSKSSEANSIMMAPEEEESESNDSKSSEAKEKGGSREDSNQDGKEKQLDGMLLKNNNNNIFLSKLKKKEPTLFLSEDDGKFSAYSKLCQASRQRQPVILTQEEKDKIDEKDAANNSKSYNHALEYGSDPTKKNWYICPRYWCLKTNSSISEADVKAGKCGKVIPKGEKTVKKGHYVYEFNHNIQHHGPDGSYQESR
jgi:hypothetical protein